MAEREFSEAFLRFIESCVPNFDAAELLLFFSRHADRSWRVDEIAEAIRPADITAARIRDCVALFKSRGLISEASDSYQFAPHSEEMRDAVAALNRAYEERPVTLIRTINTMADSKLKSFADSFK